MKKTNLLIIMLLLFGFQAVSQDGAGDGRTWIWADELGDAIADAKLYVANPKERTYIIRPVYETTWGYRSISKKEREEWRKTTQMDADERKKIYGLLDELAALYEKGLPSFAPTADMFKYGTAEEKDFLLNILQNPEKAKIHKIGLSDQTWKVEKNDDGIPTGRRKWGYIYFTPDPKLVDHKWCRMFEGYIYQQYEGGGKYGESQHFFERKWLAACPK